MEQQREVKNYLIKAEWKDISEMYKLLETSEQKTTGFPAMGEKSSKK